MKAETVADAGAGAAARSRAEGDQEGAATPAGQTQEAEGSSPAPDQDREPAPPPATPGPDDPAEAKPATAPGGTDAADAEHEGDQARDEPGDAQAPPADADPKAAAAEAPTAKTEPEPAAAPEETSEAEASPADAEPEPAQTRTDPAEAAAPAADAEHGAGQAPKEPADAQAAPATAEPVPAQAPDEPGDAQASPARPASEADPAAEGRGDARGARSDAEPAPARTAEEPAPVRDESTDAQAPPADADPKAAAAEAPPAKTEPEPAAAPEETSEAEASPADAEPEPARAPDEHGDAQASPAGAESEAAPAPAKAGEPESAPAPEETGDGRTAAGDGGSGASARADATDAARPARTPAGSGPVSPAEGAAGAKAGRDGSGGAADGPRRPAWAAKNGPAPARPAKPAWAKADADPDTDADPDPDADPDAVETDAERTSQFVALKPLEVKPAPVEAPDRPARPDPVEVTREAPLPALDLLAELTNTPPPPETPRRTAARRVKVWTPIVLLLAATVAGVQLVRPLPAPQLVIAGEPSYTVPGQTPLPWPAKGQGAVRLPGSGDVVAFGEQKPVPTASVAKVMTAYVILKNHPLRKNEPGPGIEVDAVAVAEGTAKDESRIEGLTAGTKFSEQDMLKMLMIPSGNNIARLLARWDTGSTTPDAFVAKMNAAAKELGMTDTTYTDPSGLDAGTVSTAVDQLKLAEAVMKEDAFRAVVSLANAPIPGLAAPLINNNDLLVATGLSISGIKTGSSSAAGGTLSWAAYKTVGGETPLILGTLMDQHVDGPDPDGANSLKLVKANARKVIEAVRTALAPAQVIRKGQTVGYVSDGLGGRTPLVATKDLTVPAMPGQRLRLALGSTGGKPVPHEAKAGTEVGTLTVGDGSGVKSVPVAVGSALSEPSFGARVTRLS